ncbi:MAG: pyridoxal phosphate-dependent aminotransferase [Rickettsiales bacterium]|nr:pyridoxal phosphate-dependent aminotransferase [Rickettsiales bacterium]
MSNNPLIAKKLSNIKPSATLAVTSKAAELKAQGIDIISLGAGEPDFDTHDNVKAAAIKAIKSGFTKYTAVSGIKELKEAVREKFQRDNNVTYELDEITVGNGAKQLIYNAFMATLNPGDEVIIPAPYWVSYPDMVSLCDGKPIMIDCPKEQNYLLEPSQLERAISYKTKWVILNSPSNPTGMSYSHEQLLALLKVIAKFPNIAILSDDIYEHVIYDNFVVKTPAEVMPHLKNRILTINGVSKCYAMTGWRIGFAGGSKELIKAMNVIQSQSTSNACSISQIAAAVALTTDQSYIAERNQVFKERRDIAVNVFNNIENISAITPTGAFYIFPDISGLIGKKTRNGTTIADSTSFATCLLEDANVAVVPGSAFGAENHFRISYALSTEALQDALERITKFCKSLV